MLSLLTGSAVADSLTYDLQLANGGNLKETTLNVGETVTINIYAVVSGTDSNNGFQFGYGSVTNGSSGGVTGNITSSALGTGFNFSGSSAGALSVNLDGGSGGTDLGSNSSVQNSAFFDARAKKMVTTGGTAVNSTTTEFLIGTIQYTRTDSSTVSATSSVNFVVPTFSDVFARKALFQTASGPKNDLNATIGAGTALTFSNGAADVYFNNTNTAGANNSWTADTGTTSAKTNWSTSSNSLVDTTLPGNATIVHYNGTSTAGGPLTSDLGKDFSIKGLLFNGSATNSVTLTGTGGKILTLGASGLQVNSGSAAHTISAKINLGVDQNWTNNSSNALTVSGIVSGAGKNLTKEGTGKIILTGANTYSGATTINNGFLEVAGASSISSTSRVTVNTGGTLLLSAAGGVSATGTPITLAGGTLALGSAASHTVGQLTLSGNSTLDIGAGVGNSTLTFAGGTGWDGTSVLTIENWGGSYGGVNVGGDHIYFTGGLTSTQLALIRFDRNGSGDYYSASLDGNELIAVPEPAAVGAALLLLGMVGYRERRRLGALGWTRLRTLQPVRPS